MRERPRRLLLSIHDVTPDSLGQVERLHAHLCDRAGTCPIALLVVPEHWQSVPVAGAATFRHWLRARHQAGDEILLHGWHHRDSGARAGWFTQWKATRLTAGEGEFLKLDRVEALRRLRDGRALLEDIIGAPVPGFVAPAWLYGEGAHAALREAGFAFAEDHFRVWAPGGGEIFARGPVVTWASRSRARKAGSLAFAALARATLASLPTIRIAVHPADTGEAAIMDSIRATTGHFRKTHRPSRYLDLAASGAPDTRMSPLRTA
ncbi:MAG TPA: polysaccharide deacetylase family protein [Sphingomonas sp.]|nr:polysaccharide deacetylase family protein [Sphingomonas sp.]